MSVDTALFYTIQKIKHNVKPSRTMLPQVVQTALSPAITYSTLVNVSGSGVLAALCVTHESWSNTSAVDLIAKIIIDSSTVFEAAIANYAYDSDLGPIITVYIPPALSMRFNNQLNIELKSTRVSSMSWGVTCFYALD